jgi:ABC-type cobalt transport system substrate-binding protein
MKKLLILLVILSLFAFVVAEVEQPEALGGVGGRDVENIQGTIKNYTPINEDGEFDPSVYKPFKSKAEQRIDAINLWLDNNVSWMRFIFNMKPQISFLFAANVYFILFFLLLLVLNGHTLWFFIDKKSNATLFGLGVFFVFGLAKLYVGLAMIVNNWIVYMLDVFVPALAWFIIIVIIIVAVLIIITEGSVLMIISRYFQAKNKFKLKVEQAMGTESVNKIIEQATRGGQ